MQLGERGELGVLTTTKITRTHSRGGGKRVLTVWEKADHRIILPEGGTQGEKRVWKKKGTQGKDMNSKPRAAIKGENLQESLQNTTRNGEEKDRKLAKGRKRKKKPELHRKAFLGPGQPEEMTGAVKDIQ